ncbi:MAG: hypothetical protein QM831_19580 [Kofleriaceae bacterium]
MAFDNLAIRTRSGEPNPRGGYIALGPIVGELRGNLGLPGGGEVGAKPPDEPVRERDLVGCG